MSEFAQVDDIASYLADSINDTYLSARDSTELIAMIKSDLDRFKSQKSEINKRKLYTTRDMEAIRNYLISTITNLTDEWTDFNESDAGMALVECMAGLGDMLGFQLDKNTLECFIGTVKQRKDAAAMLKLISYQMHMREPSLTTLRFSTNPIDHDIFIPKYTQVSTGSSQDSIYYATVADAYIRQGDSYVDVIAAQGIVHRSNIRVGDLRNNQKIRLLAENVSGSYVEIKIGDNLWYQKDDVVIDSLDKGRYYSLFEDQDQRPFIHFHNSYLQYLPSDDSAVCHIAFLETLGTEGNVRRGVLNNLVTNVYLDFDSNLTYSQQLDVTNIEPSSGGSDRETVDEARVQAPKSLSMLGKAIVLKDYEVLTNELPQVMKSRAIDWSVESSRYVSAPYIVELYVIPKSGTIANKALLDYIKDYFTNQDNRRIPTYVTVKVLNPDYVDVPVHATIYVKANSDQFLRIKSRITKLISDYFSPSNIEFDQDIHYSNIITLIENSDNIIDSVDLSYQEPTIRCNAKQFARLGEVTLDIKSVYESN